MTLAPRQIHLDFHTSEAIPDIAANFDPRTSLKQQGRRRLPQSLFLPAATTDGCIIHQNGFRN